MCNGFTIIMVETKNHRTLGRLLPNTQKKSLKVALLPLWFQDDL
jgi:hypothetical protein